MARKSELEEILEGAFKHPIFGVILSAVFLGVGLYLTSKGAQLGAKGAGALFLPVSAMFGKISYFLSGLTFFVSVVGYFWQSIKKKKQADYFESRRTLDDMQQLSWSDFEQYVGALFSSLGYSVRHTGGHNDGGIDLRVEKDGNSYLVQCKQYRAGKVSLSMVRDFYGAIAADLSLRGGYFVTTGIFTLDARRFAEDKPIELIDGEKLMEYVKRADIFAPADLKIMHEINSVEQKPPLCPKCGANMVLRTAKKGINAGGQFWGCLTYPACKGTLQK